MDYMHLIDYLVKTIVNEPESVKIEEGTENEIRTFFVHVAPNDVGKIIGRQGNVISAIRQLINASATKNSEKIFVKVVA